jgi:hypothetical protein
MEDLMASKEYQGDDVATQIAEEVIGMSDDEIAALIKERDLGHLTDPKRISEMLGLPESDETLH